MFGSSTPSWWPTSWEPVKATGEEADECVLIESLGARGGGAQCDGKNFMQAHLLPRGLRVRKNMAGRAIRRVLSKSADARPIFAAFVLSTHLLAFPIATQGVRLLDPAAVVSDRITRERNSDTFEAIWSLVEHMHYTGGVPPGGVAEAHGGWDRILVDTLQADDAHLAFRSENAFRKMAGSLIEALRDPYSSYASASDLLLPPTAQRFGLSVQPPAPGAAGLVVAGVSPDSPAEAAGLRIGDRILEVGGLDAPPELAPPEKLKQVLRGGQGASSTSLSLRVRHAGESLPPSVAPPVWLSLHSTDDGDDGDAAVAPVVRAGLLGPRLGYVRIRQFSEAGTEELVRAVDDLRRLGAVSWVVDLRNNPGGQLTEAMTQASMILDREAEATLAFTVDAAGDEQAHTARSSRLARLMTAATSAEVTDSNTMSPLDDQRAAGNVASSIDGGVGGRVAAEHGAPPIAYATDAPLMEGPIVLLVDRGTASAAELFAAALRDNGRGEMIGEPTFGKGLIQRLFPMPNGGVLRLTIGEYLTPRHERVEPGVGLRPDVACASRMDEGDVCLQRAALLARTSSVRARLRAERPTTRTHVQGRIAPRPSLARWTPRI